MKGSPLTANLPEQERGVIETEVAEALLDVGVSVPLKGIKIPFKRTPIRLKIVMKRPTLGTQIRIARLKGRLGLSYQELAKLSPDEQQAFIARNGKTVSRMIALMVCRGYLSGITLAPVLAWVIRWWMDDLHQQVAVSRFISLMGTKGFETIIKSVEAANPLTPTMSQTMKRS